MSQSKNKKGKKKRGFSKQNVFMLWIMLCKGERVKFNREKHKDISRISRQVMCMTESIGGDIALQWENA